jgi:hypothetical protein
MFDDFHGGDRGADAKPAVLASDLAGFPDFFDVDQKRRLDQVGLHLHDHIGAARQDTGRARRPGKQGHGGLQRIRSLVPHTLHRTSRSVFF